MTQRRRALVALVAVLVLAAGLTVWWLRGGGEDDPFADYCAEVEDRQAALTDALAGGERTALLAALPSFRALAEKAPDDLTDEWAVVVDRIEDLRAALDAAGVDAASYDRKHPPKDVSKDEQDAIAAAAAALVARPMQSALAGVEQQARDVCRTPLYL